MGVPFDIIEHIFSFLISHPESLVACSEAHPVFSRIVEKYRYYHIILHTGNTRFKYFLEPSYITKLLSDKPRIANYVRVLEVEFHYDRSQTAPYLEQIAAILPMFPMLECIVLSTLGDYVTISWEDDLPDSFRKAVEGCLHLPTVQEVHVACSDFPLSTLDNCVNIDHFSFSGTPQISEFADTTYPHLKSISIGNFFGQRSDHTIFNTWAIRHISKLHSLKYDSAIDETISELLESCSDTLNNLDLSLTGDTTSEFAMKYNFKYPCYTSDHVPILVNFASLLHLQQLTIRAAIYFFRGDTCDRYDTCITFLPAAMEILKTASSLQQLTIEIDVDFSSSYLDFHDRATIDDVDFSPLTALAQSPVSFQHINLYFNLGRRTTHTQVLSSLAKYGGLLESIGRGVLVIHLGVAPTFLVSKRTIHHDQRSLLDPFA